MTDKRILVPLDGSSESNAALPLARTLAMATGAPITLLRVLSVDDDEAALYARSNLRKIADELAGSGIHVDTVLRNGHAAEQILQELATGSIDLIVMRTHGRAGLERAIIGSVAERVLKHTPVPMVLMRPGERRVTRIQTLLVPVDGSPGGAVALGLAVALAHATGASIKLVQVAVPVAMQTALSFEYGGMGYYDPDWDDEAVTSAQAYVDAMSKRLRDQGVNAAGTALVAPSIVQGITTAAERDASDLVIMSTHALTGPARAVLGSVADAVVRNSPCPVMVVHRVEAAEENMGAPVTTAACVT
jgi:nucleotide-binding universal stress UspA family protein